MVVWFSLVLSTAQLPQKMSVASKVVKKGKFVE